MEIKSLHSILVQQNNASDGLTKKPAISQNHEDSFVDKLKDGLNEVADAQTRAAELAKNYETGSENDLSKVMVAQQVSSLGFQMTLNVRNKALSAYKDIMNMPV